MSLQKAFLVSLVCLFGFGNNVMADDLESCVADSIRRHEKTLSESQRTNLAAGERIFSTFNACDAESEIPKICREGGGEILHILNKAASEQMAGNMPSENCFEDSLLKEECLDRFATEKAESDCAAHGIQTGK